MKSSQIKTMINKLNSTDKSVLLLAKIKTEVNLFGSRIKGKCDKSA